MNAAQNKVLVVGAGAAGLLAAGFLARRGAQVTVLEKMGRAAGKVRISGKGRCNVTSALPLRDFPEHYPSGGKFLQSALHRFSNQDCLEFFAELGVELKVERGQRVFPASDQAEQIAEALERFARQSGAKIQFKQQVTGLLLSDGQVTGVTVESAGQSKEIGAAAVILATGGLSYPGTGSSGAGYRLAESAGHQIVTPRPALVPLRLAERWAAALSGLSLRNVQLTIINPLGGKRSYFGELMFAHFGLTGPIVLTASELIGRWLGDGGRPVAAFLDLKPALEPKQLDQRLQRDLTKFARRQFQNALDELLPKSLIPVVVELSGISPGKPCHELTKAERRGLGCLLKAVPLTITATLPISAAIVTAGGVATAEVEPRRLESRLVRGLFFCGEVLDVHGVTGGFNLQAAFSTGYAAAQGVNLEG